ncbi:MAG: hypothetical protein AW08_02872 [Candidatus Accumulibacter adjunctus]|uniref:Uncharacterized protein n=1 Tax=Candidatus Accumulibacter adjunctus TaxID=1454001 RepID=A0A011NMF4_9PROT|nr:MAG: hypothetical protein AW08_02872 [Candidatus Accumulibacter adjunctus]
MAAVKWKQATVLARLQPDCDLDQGGRPATGRLAAPGVEGVHPHSLLAEAERAIWSVGAGAGIGGLLLGWLPGRRRRSQYGADCSATVAEAQQVVEDRRRQAE